MRISGELERELVARVGLSWEEIEPTLLALWRQLGLTAWPHVLSIASVTRHQARLEDQADRCEQLGFTAIEHAFRSGALAWQAWLLDADKPTPEALERALTLARSAGEWTAADHLLKRAPALGIPPDHPVIVEWRKMVDALLRSCHARIATLEASYTAFLRDPTAELAEDVEYQMDWRVPPSIGNRVLAQVYSALGRPEAERQWLMALVCCPLRLPCLILFCEEQAKRSLTAAIETLDAAEALFGPSARIAIHRARHKWNAWVEGGPGVDFSAAEARQARALAEKEAPAISPEERALAHRVAAAAEAAVTGATSLTGAVKGRGEPIAWRPPADFDPPFIAWGTA